MGVEDIFGSAAERARLLDLVRQIRGSEVTALACGTPLLVWSTFYYGAGMAAPLALGILVFVLSVLQLERWRRPEWALAATWLFGLAMALVSLALAHHSRQYLYAIALIPTLIATLGLSHRAMPLICGITVLALTITGFLFDRHELLALPSILVLPCVALVILARLARILRDADVISRETAVVDQLTGTLNRVALQARLAELEAQARTQPRAVSVVLLDIDCFKTINDTCGHAAGDRVLVALAARLQEELSAGEAIYRYGGEEFMIVLPDVSLATAVDLGERLRQAIGRSELEGHSVTVSVGVASAPAGAGFHIGQVFSAADRALYEAKRSGRDRVCSSVCGPAAGDLHQVAPAVGTVVPAAHAPHVLRAILDDGRQSSARASWLLDNSAQREQMLDVTERSARTTDTNGLLGFAAVLFGIPWFGWLPLIPTVGVTAVLHRPVHNARGYRRPEWVLTGALLASIVALALSIALASRPALFSFPFFCVMTLVVSSSGGRGALLAWGLSAALMALDAVLVDAHGILHDPGVLLLPETLMICTCLITRAVGRSTTHHRARALVDPLTGVLNRTALEARLPELAHRAEVSRAPLSVILADLDHFKEINDSHGHRVGDEVLTAAAERMRTVLRAFDSIYRLGGEEFALLLESTDEDDAAELAERLRVALESEPVAGIQLTASFGVATSRADQRIDYRGLFGEADERLYMAKQAGRNCVSDGRLRVAA